MKNKFWILFVSAFLLVPSLSFAQSSEMSITKDVSNIIVNEVSDKKSESDVNINIEITEEKKKGIKQVLMEIADALIDFLFTLFEKIIKLINTILAK